MISDTIDIDNAVFVGVGANGPLASSAFVIGTAATTNANRIIYNATTGDLFFDADGAGAGAQVKFSILSKGLSLTASDFLIV